MLTCENIQGYQKLQRLLDFHGYKNKKISLIWIYVFIPD